MLRRKGGLLYFFQRLGFRIRKADEATIWLHAASVGETKIALNIYRSLSSKFPDNKFIITTYFINGKKEGTWTFRNSTGNYTNGKKDGTWTFLSSDGISEEAVYEDGELKYININD